MDVNAKQRFLFPSESATAAEGGQNLPSLDDREHEQLQDTLKCIVQVFLEAVEPSFSQPWTKDLPSSSAGTGFVVDLKLKMVVTNAHCVEFARTILLRKNGDHVQYEARLLAVSHQVDIAVLTVEDDNFWKDTAAVQFGNHCRMQQTVDVVGYPIGGDTISITRGVVSRIDWVPYAQSGGEGQVCVQVDAAINPGNSGGPVLTGGKLVGIAFQGMSNAEAASVGYIIPVTVLMRLLENFKDCAAKMDGMPSLTPPDDDESWTMTWPPVKRSIYKTPFVKLRKFARFVATYQTADNPYLRQSVGLPLDQNGVIIRDCPKVSNLYGVLKNNDVLIAIDGQNVGNEGRVVNTLSHTAMDLQYLITAKLVGEPVRFTICRNGEMMEINTVAENPPKRTPLISKEPFVSYLMFAGIVFSPLAQDSAVTDNPIADLIVKNQIEFEFSRKKKEYNKVGQQIVVLTSILPHKLTIGYKAQDITFSPIYRVDGKDVDNIFDLAKAVATAEGPLITFELCDSNCIVLPLAEGWEATWEIQQDFGMLAVMSKDVSQSLTDAGIDLELDDLVIGDDQYDEDYDYEEAGDYGNQTGDDEDA